MLTPEKMARVIEAHKDPMAPIKIEQAYNAVESLGRSLAGCCNQDDVNEIQEKLLDNFDNEELNEVSSSPAFVMALAAMINGALRAYSSKF